MNNLITALALSLALSSVVPAQVLHKDLKSGKKHLRSIVLMPLVVQLVRVGLKGPEPMNAEAHMTELPLTLELEAALAERGYCLDLNTLSTESLAKDPDERYTVDDLQKKFDAQLKLLRKKSKDVRKGRFGVGDEVAKLPLSQDTDALLFVRASGQVLTGNRRAFGVFVGGGNDEATVMNFGIVDARTGKVIYFATPDPRSNLTQDPEGIADEIGKAFSKLPKTGAAVSLLRYGSAVQPDTRTLGGRLLLSHKPLVGQRTKYVAPKYPAIASARQVEGDVIVRFVIDSNGEVTEAKAIYGPVELKHGAISTVQQWQYRPFVVKDQVFEVETETTLSYRLER